MTSILLALAALAADLEFKPRVSATGGYAVDLPALPRLTSEIGGGMTRHEMAASPVLGKRFVASHADFKAGSLKDKAPHLVLAAFRDGWRAGKDIQCEARIAVGP